MGTPGIFLSLLFRSLSQVATMKHLNCFTRFTRQSSAQVPLWLQMRRSNRGSLESWMAILYLWPSFSSSARTQSVMWGMHFPKRRSIEFLKMSSLFWMDWLMKFVSKRSLKGGPKDMLQLRKRFEGSQGSSLSWTFRMFSRSFLICFSFSNAILFQD